MGKCHICKRTGLNPKKDETNCLFHKDTQLSIYQCIECYNWYIMSIYSQRGYIWVDDSEDPISPLPSP